MPETRVDKEVFARVPRFRRGIVVARGMDNRGPSQELETLLKQALAAAAENPIDLNNDPRTAGWREIYRELGSNPKKFPPAHLSLLKRIQKPGAAIPFINKAVAIMNDNSIRGVCPVGGDNLKRAGKVLELRIARGDESFTPLSDPQAREHPDPGEIIYMVAETGEVMCRRWNWRNGWHTRITEETEALVMNIDGLDAEEGRLERGVVAVRDRVARMLKQFCGAEVETALLTPEEPRFVFEL